MFIITLGMKMVCCVSYNQRELTQPGLTLLNERLAEIDIIRRSHYPQ